MSPRAPQCGLFLFMVTAALWATLADSELVAQPTSSPGRPVRLRLVGKVIDAAGAPVPDAQLFWQALHVVDNQPVHFVEGRSGDDGSFDLNPQTDRLGFMGGRPYGYLWIVPPADHALQICEARDYLIQSDQPPKALTLKPAKPLNCQVLGPDALPREGELVEPEWVRIDRKDIQVPPRLREVLGGVTDGDGVWRMNHLDELTSIRVRVASQTYGRQFQMWPVDLAARDFNIRMRPVGSIEGQIIGTDLYRFEGRQVKVSSHKGSQRETPLAGVDAPAPVYFDTGEAATRVDREGRFKIPVIAAGQVFVHLTNPPDAEWETEGVANFDLKEGETKKIEIASARKVGFEGKVELSDGTPADGLRIEIMNGRKWNVVNTVTGKDGRFRCQVCPGELLTRVSLDTFAGIRVLNWSVRAHNFTKVAADSTNTVAETLRLPRIALVDGVVVGKSGKTMPNCTVEISAPPTGEDLMRIAVHHQLKAGPDGRFQIYRPESTPLSKYSVKVNREPAEVQETAREATTVIRVDELADELGAKGSPPAPDRRFRLDRLRFVGDRRR